MLIHKKTPVQRHQITLNDDTVIMPGLGPMTSVGAEKQFNLDITPIHS